MKGASFAIGSAVLLATSFLLRKKVLNNYTINQVIFYVYLGLIISSTFLLLFLIDDKKLNLENNVKMISLLSGLLIPFAMYCMTCAIKYLSNPAYAGIIFAVFKTIVLFLLSVYLFNLSYNKMAVLGMILSLIGVTLVILYEKE